MDKREQIIAALYAFARQRSGIEFANYGDVKAFRAEQRSITKDLQHARTLLRAVELSSITAEELEAAFSAFSGRLTLTWCEGGRARLDYCTGQYFPTEYRRAVCAVAAQALWRHKAEHCMPSDPAYAVDCYDDGRRIRATSRIWGTWATRAEAQAYANTVAQSRHPSVTELYRGKSAGDYLRDQFRREFGRGIASRWFQ